MDQYGFFPVFAVFSESHLLYIEMLSRPAQTRRSIDNLDYYISVWSSSFTTVVQMVVGIHVLYTIND